MSIIDNWEDDFYLISKLKKEKKEKEQQNIQKQNEIKKEQLKQEDLKTKYQDYLKEKGRGEYNKLTGQEKENIHNIIIKKLDNPFIAITGIESSRIYDIELVKYILEKRLKNKILSFENFCMHEK